MDYQSTGEQYKELITSESINHTHTRTVPQIVKEMSDMEINFQCLLRKKRCER